MSGDIKKAWSVLPAAGKALVVGLLILLLLFAGSVGAGSWEYFRAWRFDNAQAKKDKKIAEKDAQIQAAIKRAEAAEAKAQLSEQKAETLEAVTKQQGARADAVARKVEEAFDAFEKDSSVTSGDVPDDVRRQRICAKRRELGYPCR